MLARLVPRGVRGVEGSCDCAFKDGVRLPNGLETTRSRRGLSVQSCMLALNARGLFTEIEEAADLDPLLRGVLTLNISAPSAANSLAIALPVVAAGDKLGSSIWKDCTDCGIPICTGRRRLGDGPLSTDAKAFGEMGAVMEAEGAWVDGCPTLRPEGRRGRSPEGCTGTIDASP